MKVRVSLKFEKITGNLYEYIYAHIYMYIYILSRWAIITMKKVSNVVKNAETYILSAIISPKAVRC
jgi:hypothetical protein